MKKEYQRRIKERAAAQLFGLFVALLASLNRRSENVRVRRGIIPELEFNDRLYRSWPG
jgi:hypothetical protein